MLVFFYGTELYHPATFLTWIIKKLFCLYMVWPNSVANTIFSEYNRQEDSASIFDWIPCSGQNILLKVIWHQVWIRRFDSRAIFLRQCHFQNVLLFFRPKAVSKQQELSVWRRPMVLALKRKTTWMKPRHSLRNFVEARAMDFHCRGEWRRTGMHHSARWGKGVIGS